MAVTPLFDTPATSVRWMSHRRTLWLALAIITLISLGSIIGPLWSIKEKESQFENSLNKRLTLVASSQAKVIETWLDGLIQQGDRIVKSDLFRLYATEVDQIEGDISHLIKPNRASTQSDQAGLMAQLPELQSLFIEFTRYANFHSGRLVHRNGQAYVSTDHGISHISTEQQQLSRQVIANRTPQFSALQATPAGLILDMALPLFALEAASPQPEVVAVVILSKIVTDKVNQLLAASQLAENGERVYLIQKTTTGFAVVTPWSPNLIAPLQQDSANEIDQGLAFKKRTSIRSSNTVYSVASALNGLPWWIVQEADYNTARQALNHHARIAWGISALLIIVFAVTFSAIWFQQVGLKNRQIAQHFKTLATQIDNQRQLLNSVNDNIGDFISLKDLRGIYQYVNPAMMEALGRTMEEILTHDDHAVFGFDTAKRLEHWDQHVIATGQEVNIQETLYFKSQPLHLIISKVPLTESDGSLGGIISVMTNITELIEGQKRHEKAILRTVKALASAVELNDQYLAGHSRRLRLLGCEVIKQLGGSSQQQTTVEIAANLSQIGKMFVNKELLSAQRPLNHEERLEIEQHVEHATRILQPIAFELPIPDTIYQMNERIDGSGYPQGLEGDDIILPARVLSVVNSFCAMVEPRAYRTKKNSAEALAELEEMNHYYDSQVVAALREIVESPLGEKFLQTNYDEKLPID